MRAALLLALVALAGCADTLQRLSEIGGPPHMSPSGDPTKDPSWHPLTLPMPRPPPQVYAANSLWRPGGRAFFKDERAAAVGDILTILVNITDNADFQNTTTTTRTGSEAMAAPSLFGLQNAIPRVFPNATPANLVNTSSTNANTGAGEVKRAETVTVSLSGVVTQVLPNGNLVVIARQQVRVNGELRAMAVSGIVRPEDIHENNTVAHDRMAEARIAYGGRGELTDLQTPRYGQQLLDILLPF